MYKQRVGPLKWNGQSKEDITDEKLKEGQHIILITIAYISEY